MRELVGILLLVVLILVGALMPLRYTARMRLPKRPAATKGEDAVRTGESLPRNDAAGEKRRPG